MSAADDSRRVAIKMKEKFDNSRFQIVALAQSHRGAMQEQFLNDQPAQQNTPGKYWNNITSDARNAVFSDVFDTKDAIGFFMAHGIDYGYYLETANDRQNEALRPLIEKYGRAFIERVRKLLTS